MPGAPGGPGQGAPEAKSPVQMAQFPPRGPRIHRLEGSILDSDTILQQPARLGFLQLTQIPVHGYDTRSGPESGPRRPLDGLAQHRKVGLLACGFDVAAISLRLFASRLHFGNSRRNRPFRNVPGFRRRTHWEACDSGDFAPARPRDVPTHDVTYDDGAMIAAILRRAAGAADGQRPGLRGS